MRGFRTPAPIWGVRRRTGDETAPSRKRAKAPLKLQAALVAALGLPTGFGVAAAGARNMDPTMAAVCRVWTGSHMKLL
jgi:hypothetical protein